MLGVSEKTLYNKLNRYGRKQSCDGLHGGRLTHRLIPAVEASAQDPAAFSPRGSSRRYGGSLTFPPNGGFFVTPMPA
mgnify:CR=1 FL=1